MAGARRIYGDAAIFMFWVEICNQTYPKCSIINTRFSAQLRRESEWFIGTHRTALQKSASAPPSILLYGQEMKTCTLAHNCFAVSAVADGIPLSASWTTTALHTAGPQWDYGHCSVSTFSPCRFKKESCFHRHAGHCAPF
eukprot:m.879887 g.879887  ORF g.879887 m.879887 type:complete len:140 (-) comp23587_c2_seq1:9-428(-)